MEEAGKRVKVVKRKILDIHTVQSRDGFVGVALRHLHERETSRAARLSIRRQVNPLDRSIRCEE